MRDHIRFLLGDQTVTLAGFDPTLTVLDWLRGAPRLTGTKEGCNEGDCGACTVVLVRPEPAGLRWRAVNACIQLVGTLDGCQLLTVEHLKGADGALHAAQQAMVDCHGSQCGFCTPGFVMSMLALLHGSPEPPGGDDAIDDALAGNLCRCTGYAPIVRATRRMYALHDGDQFSARAAETLQRLQALDDGQDVAIRSDAGTFLAPASTASLAETLLRDARATIVAGCTDVGLWITKALRRPDPIVWIGRVAELQRIEHTPDALRIGAAVTYSDAMPALAALHPDMGELLRRLGSVQVRNMGTIGGNVANGSPIGDSPPALIAAGATLQLRRGAAVRTLPLEAFFLAYGRQDREPGEFVERIDVPRPTAGTRLRAYKVSKRFDQDITAVLGCFAIRVEAGAVAAARLAYGGMAGTPKRAEHAEAAMLGQPWDEATLARAQAALARDFAPLSDLRASAGYRMAVARNLLRRLHVETTQPQVQTRLVGDRSLAHA